MTSLGFLCQGYAGYLAPQWGVGIQRDRSLRPCLGEPGAPGPGFPAPLHHCGGLRRGEEVEQRALSASYCPTLSWGGQRVGGGHGTVPKHIEIGLGILIEGGLEGPGDSGRTHMMEGGWGSLQSLKDKVEPYSSAPASTSRLVPGTWY